MPASANVAAIFDLDRTITRAGTYTPFLLQCAPRSLSTMLRVLAGVAVALVYVTGFGSRSAFKARMLALFIAGTPRAQIDMWSDAFVARWLERHLRPGARAAIARHRAARHHLVLATASFDFYARVFAQRLGFEHVIATASTWDTAGCLCAALGGDNCYGPAKLAAVRAYIESLPAAPSTVVYSDHHSDFALLRWADEGVAVNPSGKLRRLAPAHNLSVVDWNIA